MPDQNRRFAEQVAFITGAGGGIGRATALAFAREGASVVVTDADGVVLWREGATRVRLRADSLGFAEGTVWTEREVGTNAIGTALVEAAPVQLFSAEHYEKEQHAWYCTAAPVHDPCTGELLGVVDVSGPALSLHRVLVHLVAETQRHAGHADVVRELIDGAAGLRRGSGDMAPGDEAWWRGHRERVEGAAREAGARAAG